MGEETEPFPFLATKEYKRMKSLQLPEKIYLDDAISYKQLVSQLFKIFKADLIDTKPYFRARPVVFDNTYKDSDYPEGFWHVITRGKRDRRVDFKRAKRLPWLKYLIQQWNHPELRCWSALEYSEHAGHEIMKYYIWYFEGKYLIVLKEIPGRYFLTTAFHVTGPREQKRFEEKYKLGNKSFI
mgnify:CR=1 FL=1